MIYDKFFVAKSKDMSETDRFFAFQKEDRIGGPDGEFVMVLRPEAGDLAAHSAIRIYACLISDTYPEFALQLMNKMDEIEAAL